MFLPFHVHQQVHLFIGEAFTMLTAEFVYGGKTINYP